MTIEEIIDQKTEGKYERKILADKVRKAMGVSERHWHRIKRGEVSIKLHKAHAAARVLGVPLKVFEHSIMEDTEEKLLSLVKKVAITRVKQKEYMVNKSKTTQEVVKKLESELDNMVLDISQLYMIK